MPEHSPCFAVGAAWGLLGVCCVHWRRLQVRERALVCYLACAGRRMG